FIVSPSLPIGFLVAGSYMHYIAGNLVFLCLFWLSWFFPERTTRSLWQPIILTLIDVVFFAAILFSDFLFTSFQIGLAGERHIFFNGMGYILYALFIVFLFIAAEVVLYRKYKRCLDNHKAPLLFMFLGTAIASTPALISNLILPGLGQFSLFAAGPLFGIPFVLFIAYAVFKHNLLNVKIIATEFFVILIILVLVIEVFAAETFGERIIKTFTLAAVSVLSYLIIRSVLKEVQTRQQIEELAGKLQLANKELKRIDQAKSDFLSMASHQLKTPLSIIKGYVSMTLEGSFGNITKKIKDQLEKVFISNERLISLVEDLLNLSRVEEGRMKYDWTDEPISDIVQQVIEEVQMEAEQKHLRITWIPPTGKLVAQVDLNKIRNVIFNLLDNAIKYTDKGTITVSVARHNKSVRVSVADTGRGISGSEIKKLFTKFTRVIEGKSNLTTTGFGLGLYVARLIVEEHKGRIWAESAGLGKGSTFIVELPLAEYTKK
ncbi:MAG: Sensor protein, partial [Parcubacteria group bacterium Gr01-1014_70]